jgi:hypothetical protein
MLHYQLLFQNSILFNFDKLVKQILFENSITRSDFLSNQEINFRKQFPTRKKAFKKQIN